MAKSALIHDVGALTVTVPMTFGKREGRKLVMAPKGSDAWALPRPCINSTIVKALARAIAGRNSSTRGAPRLSTISPRPTRSTHPISPKPVTWLFIAPNIVEAILDGREPPGLQMDHPLSQFPFEWARQRDLLSTVSLSNDGES